MSPLHLFQETSALAFNLSNRARPYARTRAQAQVICFVAFVTLRVLRRGEHE